MATQPRCPAPNDPQNQWIFCPSIPGAISGLALFSIITLAHFVQAFMYRKKFCWVICMATSWETAGFVFRVLGARDPRNELYNTGSQILVILAPLWVNAFAYMVMGRLVYYWLPSKSVWNIKARKMTKFFVWFDVLTFLVQLGGGGMLSSDDASSVSLGMKIYMVGIGVQQAFLLLFVILIIRFHHDVRQVGLARPTSWKPQLCTLYVVLTLITIRIIFRLVEFSSGAEGYIPSHEGFFYALEATPMILATGMFAIIHPGRSLTEPESEFTKLIIQKGDRNWWCCGRRTRTKIDPDFEMSEWSEDGARGLPGGQETLPRYNMEHSGELRAGERTHRHHNGTHSRKQSDRQYLRNSYGSV